MSNAAIQYRDAERLDLPSASSFETDVLCLGRQAMLRTLPPEAFKAGDTEEAERGNRIHKAREKLDPSELDEEDTAIYKRGLATEGAILAKWCEFHGFALADVEEMPRELRLYLNWPDTGAPATSGKLDVHYRAFKDGAAYILVVDWKSLWCSNLTPAEKNWQGRLQAVLAAREYDAVNVRMVFNKAMFGRGDDVEYQAADLAFAEHSIFQGLWEMKQPDAPRHAGPHCRYCPAKPYCPEAGSYNLLPSVVANSIADPVAAVQALVPADLKRIFMAMPTVTKIGEAVKERLKAMSNEDLAALGMGRKLGRNLDPIADVQAAFNALKEFGISEAELWKALKMTKGELVKAIQRDQGWGKEQTEGWLWNQILEPFIEKKRADDSLEVL